MSDFFWLSDAQMARLAPFFPKFHGKPRVNERRVLIGIIFVNRNGFRWRDAPREFGPHKTLYNRWKRWSEKGILTKMMIGLAADDGEETTVTIDATYFKAHRTASSLGGKKRAWASNRANQGRQEHKQDRPYGMGTAREGRELQGRTGQLSERGQWRCCQGLQAR